MISFTQRCKKDSMLEAGVFGSWDIYIGTLQHWRHCRFSHCPHSGPYNTENSSSQTAKSAESIDGVTVLQRCFSLFRFIFGSAMIPHLCTTWHIAVIENCPVQSRKLVKYIETYCPADYANHLSFEGWEMLSSSIISTTSNSQLASIGCLSDQSGGHNTPQQCNRQHVKERASAYCCPLQISRSELVAIPLESRTIRTIKQTAVATDVQPDAPCLRPWNQKRPRC